MAKTLELIAHVGDYKDVYRNKTTGIAFIADGSTGLRHSCHANIYDSGSIRGMKARGYWNKKDRCVRSNGFIYNIDTYVVSGELDKIAAQYCLCDACRERKNG